MLLGPRVLLRPVSPDDAPTVQLLRNDVDTHLLVEGGPYSPQSLAAVRNRLEKQASEDDTGKVDQLWLMAESREDGEPVGSCGMWGIDQFHGFAHIGIALLPSRRGQGFGTEMVSLVCDLGFRVFALRRMELETYGSNAAMRAIAERNGFTLEGMLRQREYTGDGYGDLAVYGILRDEWQARRPSAQ